MADEFTIKHACMDAQEKAIKALRFKEMIDEKGRYPKSAAIQLKNDVLRELSQTSSSINSGVDKTTGIAALLSKGDNKIKDMTTVTRNDPIKLMNSFNKKVRGLTKEKTAEGQVKAYGEYEEINYATAALMADANNRAIQAIIGHKSGIIKGIQALVPKTAIDTILFDVDGQEKTVDQVDLHELFEAIISGADRATNQNLLSDARKVLAFLCDFRKKMVDNVTRLKLLVRQLKDIGLDVGYPMITAIILANVEAVLHEPWARKYEKPMKKIKENYKPDHTHDETSYKEVVTLLCEADKNRNLDDASAPEAEAYSAFTNMAATWLPPQLLEDSSVEESEAETTDTAYYSDSKSVSSKYKKSYKKKPRQKEDEASESEDEKPKKRSTHDKEKDERREKCLNCKHCKAVGGKALTRNGKSKHPYVSPYKCHLNTKWKGYRSEWACKQLTGFEYKKKDQFTVAMGGMKDLGSDTE